MEDLDIYWFEEPVAPEDYEGYRELRAGLKVNISGRVLTVLSVRRQELKQQRL